MSITAPDGMETTYTYDTLGNLTGETDPLGNATAFTYTAESLLEKVTYANGATQSLAYDLAGNVTDEIIIDAGKEIGTKGEAFLKIVLSKDGGMLSAYLIK